MPSGPPWDPFHPTKKSSTSISAIANTSSEAQTASSQQQAHFPQKHHSNSEPPLNSIAAASERASLLRFSSIRRIWSSLLDFKDWPTYVWVPLLSVVLLAIPYLIAEMQERTRQQQIVLSAMAQSSPIYRKVLNLLEQGPVESIPLAEFDEVDQLDPLDFTGFEIVTDIRVFDLRPWTNPDHELPGPTSYGILRVRRTMQGQQNPYLRFHFFTLDEKIYFKIHNKSLQPRMRRMKTEQGTYQWEIVLDMSHVPLGGNVEIIAEAVIASDMISERDDESRFSFSVPAETGFQQIWMILPENRIYDHFELSRHPIEQPESFEIVEPHSSVELPLGSIATFQMINPQENYRYECQLNWMPTTTR